MVVDSSARSGERRERASGRVKPIGCAPRRKYGAERRSPTPVDGLGTGRQERQAPHSPIRSPRVAQSQNLRNPGLPVASGGPLCGSYLAIVFPDHGFSSPAISISGKPIAVDSLIEQPCLHGSGRHPFRDLSGSGGFASIIARWLRYFFVPSPKKRLFPFHFGALWFRRGPRLRAFVLMLSYCFAAVHQQSAGDVPGSAVVTSSGAV